MAKNQTVTIAVSTQLSSIYYNPEYKAKDLTATIGVRSILIGGIVDEEV